MLRTATFVMFSIVAIATVNTPAQKIKTVVWSGESNCGWRNSAVSANDTYKCSLVETPRGGVSSVIHNNVGLTVAFLDREDLITVAVEINNQNSEPLMFDAENWGAAHFKGREDFMSGKKPILAETSIPSRDMTRQISHRISNDNSLDEYMADIQQTVETVEIRRPDGTRVRVKKTVPDVAEQEAAQNRSQSRSMIARNASEDMRRNSLTAKTVMANASVKGLIYFRRIKKAGYVVFSMLLDDTNYIFLLPRAKK